MNHFQKGLLGLLKESITSITQMTDFLVVEEFTFTFTFCHFAKGNIIGSHQLTSCPSNLDYNSVYKISLTDNY